MPGPASCRCQDGEYADASGNAALASTGTAAIAMQFSIPRQLAMSLHGALRLCWGMEWSHPVTSWDAQSVICIAVEWGAGMAKAAGSTASARMAATKTAANFRAMETLTRMARK